MQITPIYAFENNFIWLLTGADQNAAYVVDPGDFAPVESVLTERRLALKGILLTHHHADHIGGVKPLLAAFPEAQVIGPAGASIETVTREVTEGDRVQLPELQVNFEVFSVPGHTTTHIAYYGEGALFCGDTLFAGGCGRLFGGTAAQLHNSLNKLSNLPDDTQVYCAHEYTLSNLQFAILADPENAVLAERLQRVMAQREAKQDTVPSILGEEKATNPFLRTHTDSVKRAVEDQTQQLLSDALSVFTALRVWKNRF